MTSLVFLLVAVAISVVGSLALWLHHREPTSLEHGIEEFSKEMQALSPEGAQTGRRRTSRGSGRH